MVCELQDELLRLSALEARRKTAAGVSLLDGHQATVDKALRDITAKPLYTSLSSDRSYKEKIRYTGDKRLHLESTKHNPSVLFLSFRLALGSSVY
jgi:hypothetical protein